MNFDLVVIASQELQVAISAVAGQITGFVDPRTRYGTEWIRQKSLGGCSRALEIAPAQTISANKEIPDRSNRHRFQPGIQQVDLSVSNWPPDRDIPFYGCDLLQR